jgi:DNA segregation ATPase FtsK/SpoIIIE-like protein
MDEVAPDEDVKDILMQFLGQTYSEIHKLDSHIVGTSTNLNPKAHAFKQTATQVLNSIAPQPQVQQQGPAVVVAPVSVPVAAVALPVTQPVLDKDQMEFNFDNSATAKNIMRKLDALISRMDRLEKNVATILDIIGE